MCNRTRIGNKWFEREQVQNAAREAAEFLFGDWPEDQGIGSSDVSCCTMNALETLGFKTADWRGEDAIITDQEFFAVRSAVQAHMNDILRNR